MHLKRASGVGTRLRLNGLWSSENVRVSGNGSHGRRAQHPMCWWLQSAGLPPGPAGADRNPPNGIPWYAEPGDAESMFGIPAKTVPRPS